MAGTSFSLGKKDGEKDFRQGKTNQILFLSFFFYETEAKD